MAISQTLPFLLFAGSFESAETRHLECDYCQCYIWSLLDYSLVRLRPKLL